MYRYDPATVSDLHKDAFGYRPSPDFWDMWNNGLTDEGRHAEWDYMIEVLKRSVEEEKLCEQYALEKFEDDLKLIMSTHKINLETALRWMTHTTNIESSQDAEHFVWQYGILFTERGKQIVQMLKHIHGVK